MSPIVFSTRLALFFALANLAVNGCGWLGFNVSGGYALP